MRDLLVLIVVALTIPLSFYRPFFGLLSFSWLAYMRPQDLAWGVAASLPLSKFVAVAIWLSLVLRGKLNIFRVTPVSIAMLLLWGWLLVSVLTAQNFDVAMGKFTEISKVFLVALLTVVLITNEQRFKMSMAVIGFSLGFLGLKFGVFGMLRGGVHFTKGVGGMIGDNNDFALALNMSIPILAYLSGNLQHRWMRWLAAALIPMTALTVMFTHSRGGFLSLAAITIYMLLRSRRRLVSLAMVGAAILLGSQFMSDDYLERLGTITNYENDGSAQGRLNAWEASYRMANDYPIVGVGLDNFTILFRQYAPNPDDVHVAHNTYLQILAEAGYIGLLLYCMLLATSIWTFEVARRRARKLGLSWAENGAKFLEGSLIAFMVGGMFLNRAHFDLTYHVMILGACVLRIVTWESRWLAQHPRDQGAVPTDTPGNAHQQDNLEPTQLA